MREQWVVRHRCAAIRNDEGDAARLTVKIDLDHLGVGNAGAGFQLILDFAGSDQESAEPHRISRARLIDERTVAAQPAEVAGAEEAVGGHRIRGRLGVAEIAEESRWSLDLELAEDAGPGKFAALVIAHAHARIVRHRHTAAFDALSEGSIAPADRKQRLDFARSIEAVERQAARFSRCRKIAPARLKRRKAEDLRMRERL